MKKILVVFGTRPEAIKMAPLLKEFGKKSNNFKTVICVTAQHREMLDQVLSFFQIIPDFDLNIMKPGQNLYDLTSRILLGIKDVLDVVKPDLVLVHGDTSTSTATALASFYQKIPVAHIEAGLRTHDIYSPWPEEINRKITGCIAKFHFAPTILSKRNLLKEGVKKENIFITGNTVIDSLFLVIKKINETSDLQLLILNRLENSGLSVDSCMKWVKNERKLILITGHRRENFGQGFINIFEAVNELAKKNPDFDFVFPIHLNPNVKEALNSVFCISEIQNESFHNIFFIEPQDYLPFVYLMNLSFIVLTDSGGIQEEAPSLGKPVLVLRDTSERPEAISAGTVKLVGTNKRLIIKEVEKLINDFSYYSKMSLASNPYGDGNSSIKIANYIEEILEF
jgi:UDP-N-acetylglucosamine 2-epimerase (non-hydrolysing)